MRLLEVQSSCIVQHLYVCIVKGFTISQATHLFRASVASSINHGRRFLCVNGALWLICFRQTGITGTMLRFWWEVLFSQCSTWLTWQRYARRRDPPYRRHGDRCARWGWRRRRHNLCISECPKRKVHRLSTTRLINMVAFGHVATAGAIASQRRFNGAGGTAIWMTLMAIRSAVDHLSWSQGSQAFDQATYRHQRTKIAVAINWNGSLS